MVVIKDMVVIQDNMEVEVEHTRVKWVEATNSQDSTVVISSKEDTEVGDKVFNFKVTSSKEDMEVEGTVVKIRVTSSK